MIPIRSISSALKNDYCDNADKRNLQLKAKAHICVQKWIDDKGLEGRAHTVESICEIHKRFGEHLPDELRWIDEANAGERIEVIPGGFRQHVPISAGAVPRFLARFEHVYADLGKAESIIVAAAAHHRLLWIHPFVDGNGRVARLMSYAILRETLEPEEFGRSRVG